MKNNKQERPEKAAPAIQLKNISIGQFFFICILIIGSILTNGMKLSALARSFNIKLTQKEIFGLSSITTSLNNFFFKAGSLLTSNYLKKHYQFPFMSFNFLSFPKQLEL